MIDTELISRKINLIVQDLDELKAIGAKPKAEFVAGKIDRVMAERYLERTIGRMIDLNYHIVTERDQPPPADYFQSFLKLGELGVLPADFARQIAACAGLRNRLVHEYDEIDPDKLYDGLRQALKDIPVYLDLVAQLIDVGPHAPL